MSLELGVTLTIRIRAGTSAIGSARDEVGGQTDS
jgi:hypothetical protein